MPMPTLPAALLPPRQGVEAVEAKETRFWQSAPGRAGAAARAERASARREELASSHRAREAGEAARRGARRAARGAGAEATAEATAEAAACAVQAGERRRVLARLEAAVRKRRARSGVSHPDTVAAAENLQRYLGASQGHGGGGPSTLVPC